MVSIGKNVKRISPYAFYGCKKLKVLRVSSRSLTAKKIKNCPKGSNINTVVVLKNAADHLRAYKRIATKRLPVHRTGFLQGSRNRTYDIMAIRLLI